MNTLNQRFFQIREYFKLSQEAFGNKIGLSKSGISSIESSNRSVTEKHIKLVCSEFNVNEKWFRSGKGNMIIEQDYITLDEIAKKNNINELELDIIKIFMGIEESARQDLLNQIGNVFFKHSINSIAPDLSEEDQADIDKNVEDYRNQLIEKKNKSQKASNL